MISLKRGILHLQGDTKHPLGSPTFEDRLLCYPLERLKRAWEDSHIMDEMRRWLKKGIIGAIGEITLDNNILL